MKSKEQIEELVLEKFKHRMFNPFFNVAFVEGYMQCQEDMAHLSEWQLCPKCYTKEAIISTKADAEYKCSFNHKCFCVVPNRLFCIALVMFSCGYLVRT